MENLEGLKPTRAWWRWSPCCSAPRPTGGLGVDTWIAGQSALITATKVIAVVTGHVLGVIAAHDRAVELSPRRGAIAGQLPLLLIMVGYTTGGLLLLFTT